MTKKEGEEVLENLKIDNIKFARRRAKTIL